MKQLEFCLVIIMTVVVVACDQFTTSDSSVNPTAEEDGRMNNIANTQAEYISSFTVFQLDSNDNTKGYGYEIMLNDKPYIRQLNIPAVAGIQTFASKEDARRVAEWCCYKIKNNIMPPTVTVHELDSLGVQFQ